MSAKAIGTAPESYSARVEKMRGRLVNLTSVTVRLARTKKAIVAYHELRPAVVDELLHLLADLDELAERRHEHQGRERALEKVVDQMRGAGADPAAVTLVEQQLARLRREPPVYRDTIVELTAFFEGAVAESAGLSSGGADDPAKSRAICIAIEVAHAAFGARVAKPLSERVTSQQLSKILDNRRRKHGYAADGEAGKRPAWTPERWKKFDSLW